MTSPRLVSLRTCELVGGGDEEPLVIGWHLDQSRYSSRALTLTSSNGPHLVLDESTNWFPSASLKIAAVPQCSVLGGIGNTTSFADSSS